MEFFRSRPFAVAVGATVLVLGGAGGGAVAASYISGDRIAPNTLDSSEIQNGTVTGTDLKDGTVGSADVANGGLTGTDVNDGGLTGADLKDGSIPFSKMAESFVTGMMASPYASDLDRKGGSTLLWSNTEGTDWANGAHMNLQLPEVLQVVTLDVQSTDSVPVQVQLYDDSGHSMQCVAVPVPQTTVAQCSATRRLTGPYLHIVAVRFFEEPPTTRILDNTKVDVEINGIRVG
jgi:hypothetical protein